jgi:glycerol-3-phosphate dehydrogenase (NAD(P)+)
VLLWARDAEQAARCSATAQPRYLPEVPAAGLRIDADLAEALAHGRDGLLVIATPMAGLRACCRRCRTMGARRVAVQGLRGRQRRAGPRGRAPSCGPAMPCGVLSGPSFALEVARGQPTALVAASEDDGAGRATVQAFHGDTLRIYTSTTSSASKSAAR